MKLDHWMLSILTLSTALIACPGLADQQLDTTGAATKKAPAKNAAAEPAAASAPSTPVAAPEPAVAKEKSVNVRGQAAINSEVVTRLAKGDRVMVLEEVTLKKPKVDEPAKWYKITLPTNTFVWVNSSFIDPDTKAVKPNRLNLRSGPSENHSIIGRVEKGTVVKEVEAKGDWLKIEAPANSYGFVAAHLLQREAPAPPPTVVAAEPPKPAPVVETPVVVTPPMELPAPPLPPTVVTPPPPPVISAPPPAPEPPKPPAAVTPVEDPNLKRSVVREGVVKRSVSVQAPSFYVLESLDTKRTINYLYSPSTNVTLKDFQGKRIMVTGEEGLDERWPHTPVLTVDSLQPVP